MLNLYLLKGDGASSFSEVHFFLGVDDIYEATCYVVLCLPVCFCTRCLLLACCSHSDSAVCPLCFIGSVCSVLLASHFMCQNEASKHSHFHKFLTGMFTLTTHGLKHIWAWLVGFSFVFWLQFKPTASFMFYGVDVTLVGGNYQLLNHWVQYYLRY